MKKKKINSKLNLSKKIITNLNEVKGGGFTDGCTDGCSPAQTAWNCTAGGNCSGDCGTRPPHTNTYWTEDK